MTSWSKYNLITAAIKLIYRQTHRYTDSQEQQSFTRFFLFCGTQRVFSYCISHTNMHCCNLVKWTNDKTTHVFDDASV